MDTATAFSVKAKTSMESIKGQIVTNTLDALNKNPRSSGRYNAQQGMSNTYNFTTTVLNAAYTGAGTILDMKS